VRVYLNTSALNRPFDDLSAERVRLEAEAVSQIVAAIESGRLELASSEYLDFEVGQIPDPERAYRVRTILRRADVQIALGPAAVERARSLERVGLRGLDALHIAAAEAAQARLLITTDDRMVRRARRLGEDLAIRVVRPTEALDLIAEEEHPDDEEGNL
jgi:predicted nucleic acid-binding protein